MTRWSLLIIAGVLLLAGCGGGSKKACTNPKAAHALARLENDLTAIKHAADLPTSDTLKGNATINRATDRFLLHVETAPLDNLTRNRMIDHAAAALLGTCQQCFQALEAERPIPSIAHGDLGCPAALTSVPSPNDRLSGAKSKAGRNPVGIEDPS